VVGTDGARVGITGLLGKIAQGGEEVVGLGGIGGGGGRGKGEGTAGVAEAGSFLARVVFFPERRSVPLGYVSSSLMRTRCISASGRPLCGDGMYLDARVYLLLPCWRCA